MHRFPQLAADPADEPAMAERWRENTCFAASLACPAQHDTNSFAGSVGDCVGVRPAWDGLSPTPGWAAAVGDAAISDTDRRGVAGVRRHAGGLPREIEMFAADLRAATPQVTATPRCSSVHSDGRQRRVLPSGHASDGAQRAG